MCGITGGTWNSNGSPLDRSVIDRMTDVLSHRGPDGRGIYFKQYDNGCGVALGHRRLAIIDLEGGRQPLCNEDGTVWISFNGEIYNYRELRQSLMTRGHRFRTDSDTETIVHLYEDHGVECLQHLRGMFAFAIWDERKRSLFIARDRMGEKPLVYQHTEGRFLFASEIKSLLQAPNVHRTMDPEALQQYLTFGYVPHPRTMFRDVRKLPPAHFATFRQGVLDIQRYWHPDWEYVDERPVSVLQEDLREELTASVRLQLRSDVPLGAFLSGGIDSTTIVGLMQSLVTHQAKTFTMGFTESAYDETPYARQAAEHLGSQHHELAIDPSSASLLHTLTRHFDEPFADSSAIPTYRLAQATSQHVKVALTGDGGDELFAGYPRYQTVDRLQCYDRLPGFVQSMTTNRAWQWLPNREGQRSMLERLRFRMEALHTHSDSRYIYWISCFQKQGRDRLLSPDFSQHTFDPCEDTIRSAWNVSTRTAGTRAMHCDLQLYLPGDLLAKVDILSMAHGLECRCPFLDHRVVEKAIAIPFAHHVDRNVTKPMLSHSFSKFIPRRLQQRAKQGFCVPLDAWFRGPLRDMAYDSLLSPRADRGYFQTETLRSLLWEHDSGKWNHGDKLWALLCFETWHQEYIESQVTPLSVREPSALVGQAS
ncbi:MAG: asparagine synthase (glutamine-hydrolyzing) [Pirellula sp.]|jgi:asparagine synthase (glutamine-hydrolysing)